MRWLRFRRKSDDDQLFTPIRIQMQKRNDGVLFSLFRGEEPVTLPPALPVRELRRQPELDRLEWLEELWYEEALAEENTSYLLPYGLLYGIPGEGREVLGLPAEPAKLDLHLSSEGVIGTSRFRFVLHIHHGSWKHLERTAKRTGPILTLPNGNELLMDEAVYRFARLLENVPPQEEPDAAFRFVAEVKKAARELGIPMDAYLEKQEYLFVDELDLDVEHQNGELKVRPVYRTSDPVPEEILKQMAAGAEPYAPGKGNEKIFVRPSVRQGAQKINRMAPIRGADIPRFVETPEAFLPEMEGLDLSRFGDRVKELGIRVYRAQPYVHARENNRGWFELNAGIRAVDENGETPVQFVEEELWERIEAARACGDEYIEWDGHWLKIPPDTDEFIRATRRLTQDPGLSGGVDLSGLPYVLEIYENITQLEYNLPILEAKRKMEDLGVLDPHPPSSFQAVLKPFQEEGYIWMKSLHFRKLGGLLADDMGLGKTVQVISFLAYLRETGQLAPTLIVVPKSLIANWQKEILKFAPVMAGGILVHQGPYRMKTPEEIAASQVVITTYETLVRDQLILGQIDWQAVICDEAQKIKNPTTSAAKVVKAMKARFRLALTGTPVENGLSELWSIMDYVQPGLLGSLSDFKREFIDPIEKRTGDLFDVEKKLLQRISAVYRRRTKKEELAGQLPSKTVVRREVPMGPEQQKLYLQTLDRVENGEISGLQAIQQLRLLASHPGLVDERYMDLGPDRVPKLAETLQIIGEIREKEEKALIFTEIRKMQEILRNWIRLRFDVNPLVINGETVSSRRQEAVDLFNAAPGFGVMILSPKAAGTGLTITSANHVIHYTRWWNPAVENQATDRVYRIGQEKPVTVYHPIVKDLYGMLKNGTVEEIVDRILTEKQELAQSIVVPSRSLNIEQEVLSSMGFH